MDSAGQIRQDFTMDTLKHTAQTRQRFVLWLADKLEASGELAFRLEAAAQLRQLVGGGSETVSDETTPRSDRIE